MADAITTKNITSVDEVQSVDNTDKVFVNDNGSFKQISVSNLMKQAPSGVTEETDPTVSEWAKQPTKPSYTADEVGALPVGTKIPTKTSDLTNDSGYLTQIPEEYVTETELGQKGYVIEDDIPEKLPSPGTLTFTGAVNDTYDGSVNKTINIPTGGGEGGTSDYNALANKPKLNGVEIAGNKTSTDYKIVSSEQGIENNGKFLGVGVDGNVTPVDKPTYTADEVGARPDTWTPSAEDVGALPNNTEIPSKTSDLENDSGFITNSDIPEKLPNPQKIIFTGAVTAEYDGSSQQTINIPTGGGSVDPEQIKQAVNGYLEKNPVQPTPVDKTLTQDNEAADAFVTGSRLVGIEKQFKNILTAPRKINRALIASDKKIYYKDQTEESYDKYNLFIFDVSDTNIVENIELRSNQNIIRVKISEQSINELEKTILELNRGTGVFIGTDIYFGTEAEYKIENLDVSQAKTILVYTGIDVDELDYTAIYGLTGKMVSPENTTFISSKSGTEFENYEYTENNQNDILGYYNVKEKLYAYKNTSANPTFAISFLVDTEHAYKITASGITRCRIGLFDTYNLTYGSTIENSTNAYATIAHDDTKTDIDIEFIPEINGLVVAYLSNTSSDVDVTVQSSGIDLYALDSKVKVGNENIPDNTIKKEKLAFDISAGSSATNGKIPLLSDILTSKTQPIDAIFEFDSAPNDWVTDGTGKFLDVSTDDFYDLFYNNWVGNHADGLTVTKTQLGMDQSGRYPIYEYDFCPQNYTYTVLLSSGMHTYELSAHFGLAWFMKTYMRQVDGESLSDGFEYLRKHVRIKVIPISNPWGWNQSPKKYGNCNGVNINRNFDYETDDGGSAWEQFPVQTDEWNQKGSAPFSEAETRILRDWALANPGAYFWIDCHTGLNLGPWDNFIYYSSDDKYVDKIVEGLSALEERIKTKYSKQNPTKEVRIDHSGSIRLRWGEKVAGIPGMTIEQTPNNTLWGTAINNESGDITEFAVTVYCYLFSVLPYNIDAETWIQSIIQPITSAQKNALNHLIQKDTLN